MTSLQLAGYRPQHAPLLTGSWVPGELLCFADNEARPTSLRVEGPGPASKLSERLLVVPSVGFVRFCEIEPIHRRARLEIGLQGRFDAGTAAGVLGLARGCAFGQLNLHRLYGWVRSTHPPTVEVLAAAGFVREAALPAALRHGGTLRRRELWAALAPEEGS